MKEFLHHQFLTYLITAGETDENNFSVKSQELWAVIEKAVNSKISLIQLREKKLPARLNFQLTAEAVKITKHSNTKLLVNDRADIAFAADADGVHLTSNSIPVNIIKQHFPQNFIVGVSTHSLSKAREARFQGADFAVYSPIFYTPDKGEPKGLEQLREVCKSLGNFPVLALGGINENNFAECLDAGAIGIAAIRLFENSNELPEVIERIENHRRQNV